MAICPACTGTGYSPEAKQLYDTFYDHDNQGKNAWFDKLTSDDVRALFQRDRLLEFTHTPQPGGTWKRRADNFIPHRRDVNLVTRGRRHAPNGWLGHDEVNRDIMIRARLRKRGIDPNCPECKGKGER